VTAHLGDIGDGRREIFPGDMCIVADRVPFFDVEFTSIIPVSYPLPPMLVISTRAKVVDGCVTVLLNGRLLLVIARALSRIF
jgi:hypothetical protein